ncbi:hypothetical protein RC083_19500 [Pseudoalteromonas haloplanktis]|uniref:STAS/SEC14 domain-containing protein n=1 Tax=Pseudoalteromonas haloplanktis TaxID=228 RepID=A0ABU1BJJ1_PSEHA|nr:hypothetical protein [Pseudoalteromonas haloplanktis]MDQ9093762.1 hypothetical protein [Pseudoalteromonas haloplanktis]
MDSHGKISFTWKEDVFELIVEDEFNEEGIDVNVPVLKQSVLNKAPKNWKRIEMWDQKVLGSPETIKKCQSIWNWFTIKGCTKTAFVVSNNIQVQVLEKYADKNSGIFLDIEKAYKWLQE